MVDIHSHVIPAFDDGARSLDESIAIAEFQASKGTTVLFATPHVENKIDIDKSCQIGERVEALRKEFADRDIKLRIVAGAELFPSENVLTGLDKGLPITLGPSKRYVLLDLPHSRLPSDFDAILFELLARRVTPIVAHPERCPPLRADLSKVIDLVERGVALQLNAGSFSGRHGSDAKHFVHILFEKRLAHFLATDAHRPRHDTLGDTIAALTSPENSDYLALLTKRSGQAVLDDNPLPTLPEAIEPKPRGWWASIARRFSKPVMD
jgi:protein-tyrosine phosphatase